MAKTDLAIKIYNDSDERINSVAKNEIALLQKLEKLGTDYFPVPNGGLRKQKIDNRNHPLIAMELCEYTYEDEDKLCKITSLNDLLITNTTDEVTKIQLPEFWEKDYLLEFIRFMCDAVHMLHKKNIIHRDIKPSNILIKKPSGEKYIKPFFIDFNTSLRAGSQEPTGGTNSYLPPEVRSGKRKEPDEADDLWAIAKIIAELIYGKNIKIEDNIEKHGQISFKIPDHFTQAILKALTPDPKNRFPDAKSLRAEFDDIISSMVKHEKDAEADVLLDSDEIIWIRENKTKILRDLISTFCGENELPVLKEIKDRVSSIYSSLYQDTTQSFDLADEIVRLGTDAIPSVIEQCYKLIPNSKEFHIILDALSILAQQKEDLAKRAVELYCVSSDYSVRKMCQGLCEKLHYFPTNLIDSIVDNDSLYLPDERVNIADICIKWSTDKNTMMPLNMYMCKEYILDRRRYHELKTKVATKVKDLNFDEKAGLIVGDTKYRVWEELKEYEELSPEIKKKVDEGLKELFADAFSSLGDEAFNYLKNNDLPPFSYRTRLPIARVFIAKLAQKHKATREWLFDELIRSPKIEYYYAAKRIKIDRTEDEKRILKDAAKSLDIKIIEDENIDLSFQKYLISGQKSECYFLCTKGREEPLRLIKKQIGKEGNSKKIHNMLKLLDFYKERYREIILPIVLDNWEKFSNNDYYLLGYVIKEYRIPTEALMNKAIEILQKDLSVSDKKKYATEIIENLLRR
jgi:serine/threonine protein kinase